MIALSTPVDHGGLSRTISKWAHHRPCGRPKLHTLLMILWLGIIIVKISAENDFEGSNYVTNTEDFDAMSLMPISCINYMDEPMIKFELFENNYRVQCRSNAVGIFVVSVSHYMRAYFNYQTLLQGSSFNLPSDALYLDCTFLPADTGQVLYAKIGCMERKLYTSTKLWIHLYTDKYCSQAYDDGQTVGERLKNGYEIDGYHFDAKVSFRPSFYSCASCKPGSIADDFSMEGTYWYDGTDDWIDDYVPMDDAYYVVQKYVNNEQKYDKFDDDDFYTNNDDRRLTAYGGKEITGTLLSISRGLNKDDDNNIGYSIQNWNMCKKIYKYGFWCDEDCMSLGHFRRDKWMTSDIILLVMMYVFILSLMGLIFVKRSKEFEKASINADDVDAPDLGMPPLPMALLFLTALLCITILASLRLVNETLFLAAICCIVLVICLIQVIRFEAKNYGLQDISKKFQTDYKNTSYNYGGNSLFNIT